MVCKCVVERVRKGLRGRQIRVGGGGRCVREAEFVVVGSGTGGAVGGAADKLRGKVEAGSCVVVVY